MTDHGFQAGPVGDVPADDGGGEPAPEPAGAQPPDFGEAVGQMREAEGFQPPDLRDAVAQMPEHPAQGAYYPRHAQRYAPQPEPTYDPGYGGYQDAYDLRAAADEGDPQAIAVLAQQTAAEAARAEVQAVRAEYQQERDVERLNALADQYPNLQEPEVLNAVIGRLNALGLSETDPDAVQMAYFAEEAKRAGLGQPIPPERQPPERQGVALETGTGARPSEAPELEPQEQAWRSALSQQHKPNKFGL
jgi:hypothetical protein